MAEHFIKHSTNYSDISKNREIIEILYLKPQTQCLRKFKMLYKAHKTVPNKPLKRPNQSSIKYKF